jgi:hypothetical protein
LVADAAHGHNTVERMKSLGGELAQEHQDFQAELAATRERLQAQRTESERRKHLDDLRERLLKEWEQLPFDQLQVMLREVVDRIEVDDGELRVFLRA